jgi:hypothetical protein
MGTEDAATRMKRLTDSQKTAPKFPKLRGMPSEAIQNFAKKKGTTIDSVQAGWLSRHADVNATVDKSSDEAIAANGPDE